MCVPVNSSERRKRPHPENNRFGTINVDTQHTGCPEKWRRGFYSLW